MKKYLAIAAALLFAVGHAQACQRAGSFAVASTSFSTVVFSPFAVTVAEPTAFAVAAPFFAPAPVVVTSPFVFTSFRARAFTPTVVVGSFSSAVAVRGAAAVAGGAAASAGRAKSVTRTGIFGRSVTRSRAVAK